MGRLKLVSAILVFTLLAAPAASELENLDGSEWLNEDYNWSLQLQTNANYSYSNITVRNETLHLGNDSISIEHNSTEQVNSTLHRFNLTQPQTENPLIKIGTNASENTRVNYSFTELPGISFGNYRVLVDGDLKKKNSSGGEISWSHSEWSQHNFTVTYQNDTQKPGLSLSLSSKTVDEDESVEIKCSSSDESGIKETGLEITDPDGDKTTASCGTTFTGTGQTGEYTVKYTATDKAGNTASTTETFEVESSGFFGGGSSSTTQDQNPSDTHSWAGVNRKEFRMQPGQETGVNNITVETRKNKSSFEISIEKLREKPEDVDEPGNTYSYLQIDVSASDEDIQNSSIEFSVNRSFAQEHDEVVLSRYSQESWNNLPTQPVEKDGEEWTYEASTTGFSYYAVRGVTQGENQTQTEQDNEQESGQETGENQTTEPGENNATDENQSQTDQETDQEEGGLPLQLILVALLIGLLLSYSFYRLKQEG